MRNNWFPLLLFAVVLIVFINNSIGDSKQKAEEDRLFEAYRAQEPMDTVWHAWNIDQIPGYSNSGKLIRYGHDLIANTACYLGPKGTVAQISNGMNCQNCHIAAGTQPFGNNFSKVYSTYPQFRARNNGIQSIYGRINDCMKRSLNGSIMDSSTREMQAMYAYIKWLGEDIPKGVERGGTGVVKMKYPDEAADPGAGKKVYATTCQSCHGDNGQGLLNIQGNGYTYPPLWGQQSYNDGAGLYRVSSFAGFVKSNMPFGTDYHNAQLTDKQAWDVAAFVNSQPRPHKDQHTDWKDIAKKPVDFPFGPYNDTFTEQQHKYGPFKPILISKNK